jgi:hypothetical protein
MGYNGVGWGVYMRYWEHQALVEHLEKREASKPLMDTALEEYGKSCRLFKLSQMFEKWTLGEIDSGAATRYFRGKLFDEPDSGIKDRLQEYINYINSETKSELPEPHDEEELRIVKYFKGNGMVDIQSTRSPWKLTDTPRNVLNWFFYNNGPHDLTPEFFQKNFITQDGKMLDIETVKRYFREEKQRAEYQKKYPESNLKI